MAASGTTEGGTEDDLYNFVNLPHEILDLILQTKSLDARDICNVSETCSILNNVCHSNDLWRQKLHHRWPGLIQRYQRSRSCDWSAEYQKCHMVETKVRQLVGKLSPTYYHCEEVSEDGFEEIVKIVDDCTAEEMVLNSLMDIVQDNDRNANLTNKYYAAKVLRHIQHCCLEKKWKAHLAEEPCNQLVETGAVLLSQWCQPTDNIIANTVYDCLDCMATEVIAKCPENIASKFVDGKPQGPWNPEQERVILESLNVVLFQTHGIRGNEENYYDHLNSYIDKVLVRKLGIPITLSIVYCAVARRLGVTCEMINFPRHLLIKWKEHPLGSPNQQYTYIDPFNKGQFLTQEELPVAFHIPLNMFLSSDFSGIQPVEVYKRMCRNLISIGRQQNNGGDSLLCLRNALDLSLILCPDYIDTMLLSVRVNLHLNINLNKMKQMLQKIVELDETQLRLVDYLRECVNEQIQEYQLKKDKKITPKLRFEGNNTKVQFSVGLVMQHKRYHYMCVIYGWDDKCKATKEWIHQMGVNHLPKKDKQPFYNVLVEDGSNRYAAQENLQFPDKVSPITHPEVGKFFERFTGSYYIPNKEKSTEYPQDVTKTEKLIRQYQESCSSNTE